MDKGVFNYKSGNPLKKYTVAYNTCESSYFKDTVPVLYLGALTSLLSVSCGMSCIGSFK